MAKEDTQFKPGQSGNPAGKPKGAKTRTTEAMREIIRQAIDRNLDNLEQDLDNMSERNRWAIIEKLNKYIMPQLNKNDNDTTINGGLNIKVSYEDETDGVGGTLLESDENNA